MRKAFGWLFIFMFCGLMYYWQPEFFQQSYHYIERGDMPGLALFLQSFGSWTVTIIIGLFVLMTFTIVFPFVILSGATSLIYGVGWGILLSWIGEFIGAIFMFFFARYFFRHSVEKWITKSPYLKQVDDYSADNGFKALLAARLLPLAPSGIITAVASVSRISFRDFCFATLIGKLPPVVVKVFLGHDLVYAKDNMNRLIGMVLLVIAVYGVYWWLQRRKEKPQES